MSAAPKSSASHDRHAYIPAHVEQAMTKQLQQNLPANLRQYVGSNKPTYIPQHAQQQLTQHMQKISPSYAKQYAGAYVQQNVVNPSLQSRSNPMPATPVTPRAPAPNPLRQDHSNVNASQYEAQFHNLFQSDAQQNQTGQPAGQSQAPFPPPGPYTPQGPAPQPASPNPEYDFIMNNGPQEKPPKIPGANSLPKRILIFSGGLLVLLTLFVIVKGMIGGESLPESYLTVAQQQQALIHVSEAALQQDNLSSDNRNFAATTDLALTSSKSDLLQYMTKNGQKVKDKQLNLKVSKAVDNRLEAAAAATTYNETFQDIMRSQLEEYANTIQQAFQKSKGQNGRALLKDQYAQAQLLQEQLKSTNSSQ